jgi:hypothetical protein
MVPSKGTFPAVVVLILTLLVTTACSNSPQTAQTRAPKPSPTPSPTPSISLAPTLDINGSATKNFVVFENALSKAGAGTPGHDVSASIASLLEAGFSIDAISHTSVTSKIGAPSDSVSLAVEFASECLIGQFSSSWLTTEVAPITDSGCLIGDVEKPQ